MNTMPLKNLENSLPESSPKPLLNTSPTTPLTPLIVTSIISPGSGEDQKDITIATSPTDSAASPKDLQDTSRNSDSGKSSSCSPTLLDCSFDSGIAGVLLDTNDMQLHKRIQQCQRILLALERDRENFSLLRNRLSKISDRKKRKLVEGTEFLCNVCCAEINPEDAKTFVKCYICQKYICRSIKCADWLPKTAQWECELCQTSKESMAQTSSWVADQISFNQQKLVYPMRARSEIYIPISECNDSSIHFESVSQIGATSALITAEQKLKIREYVEEIVSQMLGGNLDTISVNQLTKSENYLLLFHKYHSRLSNILINLENALTFRAINKGDLPASKSNGHILNQHSYLNGSILRQEGEGSTRPVSRESTPGPDFTDISETRLRSMIQKIITETIDMPPLSKTYAVSEIALDRPSKLIENGGLANGHRHRTEHYFEPTIYQDLLATAVLNKIVDKQSVNNRTISESSPDLTRDIVDGVDLDQNYNNENNSVTSGSSIEPRSDCSYTDTEPNITTNDDKSSSVLHTGRESVMSDYLAGHMVPLPDLSNIGGESEEDDYMSVTSSAIGDSTWENNWLFKKKKLSGLGTGSVSTSSIGMLVPDPKEDVRAQIGDKTADEISDLSELGSDTDDSSMDLLRTTVEPINDRLFNKHLIGGQNSKMVLDELIERSSMISNTLPMDQEDAYAETRNMNVEAPSQNEAINTKVNHQNMSTITNNNNNHEDQNNLEVPTDAEEKDSNPLAGSIAEREYKKWYNAVEMPNNPYAPEALKRRISGSQERFIDLPNINKTSEQCPLEMITKEKLENNEADKRESEYRRYSRDYYINDGSKSSQASSTSPVRETPKDVTEIEQKAEQTLKLPPNELDQSEEPIVLSVYKAMPAQVVEDSLTTTATTPTSSSSFDTISQQSLQSVGATTSDDSDTVKIYDFKKQETTIIPRNTMDSNKSIDKEKSEQEQETGKLVLRPTVLNLSRQESSSTSIPTPTRGSTPPAFKFLQPKRKLLDPSQILSVEEGAKELIGVYAEKPVIEKEVAHALPSVKALAKVFLTTPSTEQQQTAEKVWLRKTKVVPAASNGQMSPLKLIENPNNDLEKWEEDVTITSDLSSLETDPSSVLKTAEDAKDDQNSNSPTNAPENTTTVATTTTITTVNENSTTTTPPTVPKGVLKTNIAFFENLKNK
ncbi:myosin-7a binding protein isoform X7 [Haematobia irritans]|uniref:myosin-7a binding protein isoform X7 n=1 Tax=Haematobia irritans TaxID=7368 RepID=UPI003F4F4A16